jgi:hypothetical protein
VARRRRARAWEPRKPKRHKRHPVQRVVIGSGMAVIVWVLERRILKGLHSKGFDARTAPGEDAADATAVRLED